MRGGNVISSILSGCENGGGTDAWLWRQDPRALLEENPDWFLSFTIILGVNLDPQFELSLSDLLWKGKQSSLPDFQIMSFIYLLIFGISILQLASDNGEKSPDIPLITVRNSGFVGIVRTQYREHCSMFACTRSFSYSNADIAVDPIPTVVDTHPDTLHTLRIDTPFEELKDYAMGLDMEIMDSMEHSHIPYVVLLVKCVEDWKIRVSEILFRRVLRR